MSPRFPGRRSAAVAVVLTLPLTMGGCACFAPLLRAVDAALTPDPAMTAPQPAPTRVKGYSRTQAGERAPRHRRVAALDPHPRAEPKPAAAQPAPSDEADPQQIARQAEQLAAAEAASRSASEKAVETARALMQKGEVQAARRKLLAAMTGSNAVVVLGFARTFDPNELARLPKVDASPDPQRARALYEHALKMGAKEAAEALKHLPPAPPPPSPPKPAAAR